MLTYSEAEVFSREDLACYRVATKFVRDLPDVDLQGRVLRCHEVTRATARLLCRFDHKDESRVTVCDGFYELACQHSWLQLSSRHVLDVYAVGRLPPVQLIARVTTIPHRYNERDIGLEVREDVVDYLLRAVETKKREVAILTGRIPARR